MNALLQKLKKNTKVGLTDILTESKVYGHKDSIRTKVPMINVAASGHVDGGITAGLTVIAGPSKHFKTAFALLIAASFQEKYKDGVVLFYDSEFGSPESYVTSFGIDASRMIHTPLTNIEELKFDIMSQLEGLERKDKIMIVIDSIGNLASKKEVEDAMKESSAADMTRARQLKSLFRMITPHLTLKDIPLIAINHTYMTQEMYSKAVVSGGTGIYYSADNIWIVGRQQDKEGTEIMGYDFIINIEKSRYVREKSKIPISVSYAKGINKWSGMVETALEGRYIAKPSNGWYQIVDQETGELIGEKMRLKEFEDSDSFWTNLLTKTTFPDYIAKKYSFGGGELMINDNTEETIIDNDDYVEDEE